MIFRFVCEVGHVIDVESAPEPDVFAMIGQCPEPVNGPNGVKVACNRRTVWKPQKTKHQVRLPKQ